MDTPKLPQIKQVVGPPSKPTRQHQVHPAYLVAFTGDLTRHPTSFMMMLDMEKRKLMHYRFRSVEQVEDQYRAVDTLKDGLAASIHVSHIDFRGHDNDLYGSGLLLAVRSRRLPPVYLHRGPDYPYDKPVRDDTDADDDDLDWFQAA